MENKEQAAGDYLNKFLKDTNENVSEIKHSMVSEKSPSLDFLNVDLDQLPLGIFYKPGTQIKIRAAKVAEVQAYSVIDDKNFLDVTEKMNQLLSSCVKVTLSGGKMGSYKDVRDGDRLYLIFMIRELTFQRGNSLAKDIKCNFCSNEFKIPFRATSNRESAKTFEIHEMPEKISKFFDEELRCFIFNINGVKYKLAPPTIGIQETFFADIKEKVKGEKTPNVSFLKIIPYMLYDRTTITDDGIKAKEDEFKQMDMTTFQILNQAVDKMIFGLKGLTAVCKECGQEVHTDMTFPDGASSLFIISGIFDEFTEK